MYRDDLGRYKKGSNLKDLVGLKFNKLTVVEMTPKVTRKTYWKCLCDCGNTTIVRSDLLQSGNTKSCGCHKKDVDSKKARTILKKVNTKHGIASTHIYQIWNGILKRCYNPKDSHYNSYGGRGVVVCDEWKNNCKAFERFCLENGYEKGLEIDRINVNGNYEPSNCRFVTRKINCNNRRTNINITHNGKTMTLSQWCEILNLKYGTINSRYHRGVRPPELFMKTIPR